MTVSSIYIFLYSPFTLNLIYHKLFFPDYLSFHHHHPHPPAVASAHTSLPCTKPTTFVNISPNPCISLNSREHLFTSTYLVRTFSPWYVIRTTLAVFGLVTCPYKRYLCEELEVILDYTLTLSLRQGRSWRHR